jgi:hypothetical protein
MEISKEQTRTAFAEKLRRIKPEDRDTINDRIDILLERRGGEILKKTNGFDTGGYIPA